MEGIGGGIDWSRWSRIPQLNECEMEVETESSIRLVILSLRSFVNGMKEQSFGASLVHEELRSKVQFLWKIGGNVLIRFKLGNQCIKMMGKLAFFNSVSLDARLMESGKYWTVLLMLQDLGFLTITTRSTTTILISAQLPALMDEIKEKNYPEDTKLLQKILIIVTSYKPKDRDNVWHDAMTSVWQHSLRHGIKLIRDNIYRWLEYLEYLLQDELQSTDGQIEVLSRAIDVFTDEYGNLSGMTMELRFAHLLLLLRSEDVECFLTESWNYRPHLGVFLMTSDEGWKQMGLGSTKRYNYPLWLDRTKPKQLELAEFIYERGLEMVDPTAKALLFQESLDYGILGHNIWRTSLESTGDICFSVTLSLESTGDICFSVTLKSFLQSGKTDQMVAFVSEIREILIRRPFYFALPWFPDAILGVEGVGREMILTQLSLLLNHFYNTEHRDKKSSLEYLFRCENDLEDWNRILMEKSLLKYLLRCETDLENWNRILMVMREKRENWREETTDLTKVGLCVELESFMLDTVKNSLTQELVNESLDFTKQLVVFLLNDGAYGEKYLVVKSHTHRFQQDPLVLVIRTYLARNRPEDLLSYLSEYEELLENKYGDRVGPVTNGILLFGEWFRNQIQDEMIHGEKFKELLQAVKSKTQNRMVIVSNHPNEKKSWMAGYADLIIKDCDTYLAQK